MLQGCLAAFPAHEGARDEPVLRLEIFFAGRTHGDGTLDKRAGSRTPVQVEGRGYAQADGSFRLEQTVTIEGREEQRTWRLMKRGAHDYSGSLSGASGEVAAQAEGNLVRLRYRLRAGIFMDQELYLQPDGRTVLNFATVSVLGIPWARLAERITKIEDP